MASNGTKTFWEIIQPLDFEELILAFCLSILIGLLIGILIFLLLTWMSRRRTTSVSITRRQNQSSNLSSSSNPHCHLKHYKSYGFDKNSEYAGRATLNLHRQTSVDPNELLGRSPSFLNSTFRPPPKKAKSKTSDDMEDDNQDALIPNITDPFSMEPAESFWLGKGSLRGFLPRQTPPPAYDSVIHIFQETCT